MSIHRAKNIIFESNTYLENRKVKTITFVITCSRDKGGEQWSCDPNIFFIILHMVAHDMALDHIKN